MAIEDRGFASMKRSKQQEIASKGGVAAHEKGVAPEWTSKTARAAAKISARVRRNPKRRRILIKAKRKRN